jgi:hypothetical protein
MKKEKKIEKNEPAISANLCHHQKSKSMLNLNESVVELDENKCGRVKLLEPSIARLRKEEEDNETSSTSSLIRMTNKTQSKSTLLKPFTVTIYLLSSLFLFQLALTTIGFYLQFNYLKTQNNLLETKISKYFDTILVNINQDFVKLLEHVSSIRNTNENDDFGGANDEQFMILNLTHAINLVDGLSLDEINNTVLAYREKLFNTVLNENLNSRVKRNAKLSSPLPSSFYHKVTLNNQSNSRIHRHQADSTFFITDKQPKNVTGEHFLIQAYSKISVLLANIAQRRNQTCLKYFFMSLRCQRWRNTVQQHEITVRRRHQVP